METQYSVRCQHVEPLGLRDADDEPVFTALNNPDDVIMTKDGDFVDLVTRKGVPPQVLWVRIGNCGNEDLRSYLACALPQAIQLLNAGEPVGELTRVDAL